jgi:uncharacterized delta-60 repeat protein
LIQPDGKIVGSGTNSTGPTTDTTVVRYNLNGSLDAGFGTGGIMTTRVGTTASIGEAIAVQTNGKIVIAGNSFSGTNFDFGAVRLNPNGSLDSSFGTGGKVITPIGSRDDNVRDAAIQGDDRFVVVGHSENAAAGFNEDFALVRYLGDSRAEFDFDGDGKTDYGVFRPSDRIWYLLNSQSGFSATQFGLSSDRPLPADYDGDGKTDIAVYRSGTWYLLRSTLGFTGVNFGLANDIPVPTDFDGDGKAEVAVFRPSEGNWYLLNLATDQFSATHFGTNGDKPVPADYDGDGVSDVAVFRPSDGNWYMLQSTQGYTGVHFGLSTDRPVPADFDGDGKADQAVYRDGMWYLNQSTQGFTGFPFGLATDRPSVGDCDGDGKADISVWRHSDGIFYLLRSGTGNQFDALHFGMDGDLPIAGSYVP